MPHCFHDPVILLDKMKAFSLLASLIILIECARN